jgi:hypothetical protein
MGLESNKGRKKIHIHLSVTSFTSLVAITNVTAQGALIIYFV